MADKAMALSIIIRTVNKTTAGINAFNKELDEITKPTRDLKKAFGELKEKSGFNDVADGFKGVGSAVMDLFGKVLMVGGVVVGAALGVKALVDEFAKLGHTAKLMGVETDFLAGMRFAAEKTGLSVEQLDGGLQAFTANLGQARAGSGRMAKFVGEVSPVLLAQLKASHGTADALGILADAMAKVTDPAKRLALAQKTVGDPALAQLLARGSKGMQELMAAYAKLAGSQEEAAAASLSVEDSMINLNAASQGVKAALVTGLAPALKVIVEKLSAWLVDHRQDIKQWAEDIGKKLPGAVDDVVKAVQKAVDKAAWFIDKIGGINVAIGVLAVSVGPLVSAFATLGVAMTTTPFGAALTALGLISALVIKITSEVFKMYDAMDASHEVQLEDLSKMSHEQYMAKYGDKIKADPIDPDSTLGQAIKYGPGGPASVFAPKPALDFFKLTRGAYLPGMLGPGPTPAPEADPDPAPGPSSTPEVRIKVDFANAPRGTRATVVDPQSTTDIDMTMGYQMMVGV